MNNSASKHQQCSLEDVEEFLRILREILQAGDFNLSRDLDIILKKTGESSDDPNTTQNTLLALEFDSEDVRQQLLELKGENYYETVLDDRDPASPPFYVFIKEIMHRNVYIKVKIRKLKHRQVFCVSFHFARYPIRTMPYPA